MDRNRKAFSSKALRIVISLVGSALLTFMVGIQYASSQALSPQDIIDAILGRSITTDEMDVNLDGKVDAADVVAFVAETEPETLEDNIWAVSINFRSPGSTGEVTNNSYGFIVGLEFQDNGAKGLGAVITTLGGFDPTKALTRQNIASEGELPGSGRMEANPYSFSAEIPIGTQFTEISGGDPSIVTLRSDTIEIDGSRNPLGRMFSRYWILEINLDALASPDIVIEGTVTETTTGFLPDSRLLTLTGDLTLDVHSAREIAPIGFNPPEVIISK